MSRQPFVDLTAQYEEVRAELLPEVERLLATGAFIGGEPVSRFEAAFAAYCGVPHAVGVANGTDALHLALRALGVGPGDEVVTVANTFVATVGAIAQAGARPVLVDARPDTLLMDAAALDAVATPATRAVIPVHLYGRLVEMAPIVRWCASHGVALLEDAAQAHGARAGGRRAGAFGDAAGFSFYPAKNLGAGEAGAIGRATRRSRSDAEAARSRPGGRVSAPPVGGNSRIDAIPGAALLAVKLAALTSNAGRRRWRRPDIRCDGSTAWGIDAPRFLRATCITPFRVPRPTTRDLRRFCSCRAASTRGCTIRSRCTCSPTSGPRSPRWRLPGG